MKFNGKQISTREVVYSPVHDKNIRKDISNSLIWKECHHREELDDVAGMWAYSIYFRGLTPTQVTKIEQN
jgi:hypothetical protein